MTNVWRIRVLVVGGVVLMIEATMVIAGMRPQLILVATLAVVAAAVVWLALDLGEAVEPAAWRARTRQPTAALAADSRSRLMRTRLARMTSDGPTLQLLHTSLVGLVDDRLLTEHLIDRNQDPDAAHAILDAELTRFVNEDPSSIPLSEAHELARIVTLIENI